MAELLVRLNCKHICPLDFGWLFIANGKAFPFCLGEELSAESLIVEKDIDVLFGGDEICDGTHDSVHSYIFFPIRVQKSNPIVTTGLLDYSYHPIVQALAPYHTAGCCAVTGLVPHALFIGCNNYNTFIMVCQLKDVVK